MSNDVSPAAQILGDLAPKLVELTDEVLFGDVRARPGLPPRDRSLMTVAALALVTGYGHRSDEVTSAVGPGPTGSPSRSWLRRSRTWPFCTGWPNAMTGMTHLKGVLAEQLGDTAPGGK